MKMICGFVFDLHYSFIYLSKNAIIRYYQKKKKFYGTTVRNGLP